MPTLDEALSSAFDSVPDQEPQAEAPAVETPAPELEARPERARDEQGRFAPKQETQPEPEKQQQVAPETPAVKGPPKSWKKDYHEHWSKLDPSVQDYVLQREDEYFRGVGSYKQQAEVGSQFLEAARPYEAQFRAMGVHPVQAFQSLMNADYRLRTSDPATKAQLFAQLAQQYGVDLGAVQNPPEVDPQAQHYNSTIQQLQAQIAQQQRMFEELQQSMLAPQIQQYAEKPYFDELRLEMANLLNAGLAQSLDDAYDKALRLSPHYETLVAQQRQEAEKARLQESAQAAARAKATAVQVKGSPSTALPDTRRDLRSLVEAAWDQNFR